jgi:hypothetical protein
MIIFILLLLLFNNSVLIESADNKCEKRLNIALTLIQKDYDSNIFFFEGAYQQIDCFKVDSTIKYSMLTYPWCGNVINYYSDTSKYKTLADKVRYLRKQEVIRKQEYIPLKIDLSKIDRNDINCQYHIGIEIIHQNIYYISLSSEITDGRFVAFYFVFNEKDSVIYSHTNHLRP